MATQHSNSYLPLDQEADQAKAGIRARLRVGETVSYTDVEAIDDMRWDELCKELNVVEVPGAGYRIQESQVVVAGQKVDFAAAVSLMDDEIREHIHSTIEGTTHPAHPSRVCTDQEFVDTYAEAHAEKFGKDFQVS